MEFQTTKKGFVDSSSNPFKQNIFTFILKIIPQVCSKYPSKEMRRCSSYQKYHSLWMESARTQQRVPQQSSYERHLWNNHKTQTCFPHKASKNTRPSVRDEMLFLLIKFKLWKCFCSLKSNICLKIIGKNEKFKCCLRNTLKILYSNIQNISKK